MSYKFLKEKTLREITLLLYLKLDFNIIDGETYIKINNFYDDPSVIQSFGGLFNKDDIKCLAEAFLELEYTNIHFDDIFVSYGHNTFIHKNTNTIFSVLDSLEKSTIYGRIISNKIKYDILPNLEQTIVDSLDIDSLDSNLRRNTSMHQFCDASMVVEILKNGFGGGNAEFNFYANRVDREVGKKAFIKNVDNLPLEKSYSLSIFKNLKFE